MFKKTVTQIQATALVVCKTFRRFLFYGGSRSGKSFFILFCIILMCCKFPGSRHLIVRFRFNAAKRSIWHDTLPKVLKICFPGLVVKFDNQDYFVLFPNGSEIWLAGSDDKDRADKILGMEFLTMFFNEASEISYHVYSTFLSRLAQRIEGARNMIFIDENPPSKKHWTYRLFFDLIEPEDNKPIRNPEIYAKLQLNPDDNKENIAEDYLLTLNAMPERKKLRFLKGEFADDSDYALWTQELINELRIPTKQACPPLLRIAVSLDPSTTSTSTSDEWGITVGGIDAAGHGYLLEDLSGIYSPTEALRIAAAAWHRHKATEMIAEKNQGGDFIKDLMAMIDKTIYVDLINAIRDKKTRAEPVAGLYANGLIHHVGDEFVEMEYEQTTWEGRKGEPSPNRIDSLVWLFTCLIIDKTRKKFRGSKIHSN